MDRDDSDGFEAFLGLKSGGFVAMVLACGRYFHLQVRANHSVCGALGEIGPASTTRMYS